MSVKVALPLTCPVLVSGSPTVTHTGGRDAGVDGHGDGDGRAGQTLCAVAVNVSVVVNPPRLAACWVGGVGESPSRSGSPPLRWVGWR